MQKYISSILRITHDSSLRITVKNQNHHTTDQAPTQLQLEERQVGQRQLVAIKPISFEENLTNISCRYGKNIKFVLLSVLERMKYTIHLFRNQIKLLHSFSSLILNVKLDICLGQVEEKREKRQILPFFQKKCLEMSRKIY